MLVNGKQYSFADLQFAFLGRPSTGVTGIKYGEKTDRKLIFATGRKATAYADGQTKYDGEITLLQSEFEAVVRSLQAGKSVSTLPPFDIIVSYIPDDENPVIVVDTVVSVLLTGWEKALKSGDLNQEITLPFLFADFRSE